MLRDFGVSRGEMNASYFIHHQYSHISFVYLFMCICDSFSMYTDYMYECNNPWATPPEKCDVYPGQKAGRYDNSKKVANVAGRTDVEGCCWWGRGVIQTTGVW